MATRRGVIPLRKFTVFAALFAVLLAACSSTPGLVATVNGTTTITEADLGALYETKTLPHNEELREAIFALAAREVLLQAMEADFGVSLDRDAVERLYGELAARRDALGQSTAAFLGIPNASDAMLHFDAELAVLRRQVANLLVSDPKFIDLLFTDPTVITRVCAAHVLVATEEEGRAVLDRIEAGESIASVADELSLDTGVGGDLGCRIAGEYVDAFAAAAVAAPLGDPFGPVESAFGWHVLIVTERSMPTREEVAADPIEYLPVSEVNAEWQEWFNARLSSADVVVEPKFGTWSPIGIAPPG